MSVRNVGNNDNQNMICDFQNDIKGAKNPTAEQSVQQNVAEKQSTPPSSTNLQEKSLRARTDLSSSSVRSALDSKLGSKEATRVNIGREFQPAINNLLQGVNRLSVGVSKYQSHIEKALNSTRTDASNFLHHASNAQKSLTETRPTIANESQDLAGKLDNLLKNLQDLTNSLKTSTGDFNFGVNRALNDLNSGLAGLEKATNLIASGQAMALPKALAANNEIALAPAKINTQAKNYAQSVQTAVEPVATQAQNLASDVDSFSFKGLVDKAKNAVTGVFNKAKDALGDLADKAFKFVYNVKEKAGSYIDEYVGPISKAIGTGIINIFRSDKNPVGKSIDLNKLVDNTKEMRELFNAAKNGNASAAAKLQSVYGYNTSTFPKPGTMWVAANFAAGELENGKVTSNNFPTSNPTSGAGQRATVSDPHKPADINKMLFENDSNTSSLTFSKGMTLIDKDGKTRAVGSMNEYKQVVAENRAKLGMPLQGGEPIPIQLSLEGGGGKGKRYAPVFEEMYNLGVVPASVSGTSAGAIAAALVAGGIDPRQVDDVAKDPAVKKFFDATLAGPGLLEGRELYRYMDQKLREITGITDRPVTFADLPMPLYLTATKLADSQATNDMTKLEDRLFIFSKENTPNTPVAMAVVASTSIPGAFDPVEMVDPATGRTIRLCDGGVLDNLPVNSHKNNLPQIAVSLNGPNGANQDPNNVGSPKPFPPGNLISGNPIGNAKIGLDLLDKAATDQRDFHDSMRPKPGTFVLAVPTWNLQDFSKQNSTFGFEYDQKIDPGLDTQTVKVTHDFFRQFLGKLNDPKASGTNLRERPASNAFNRTFTANGATWTATHEKGSDNVTFRRSDGKTYNLALGNDRMNDWIADDVSFGDLSFRLRDVVVAREKFVFGI
ncbi:MAG: patatin-like phospholipase family protein [Acidobacteria bacterium]|nr:patatin-like phospholipase family protein [Acidobacteriota bacterium]